MCRNYCAGDVCQMNLRPAPGAQSSDTCCALHLSWEHAAGKFTRLRPTLLAKLGCAGCHWYLGRLWSASPPVRLLRCCCLHRFRRLTQNRWAMHGPSRPFAQENCLSDCFDIVACIVSTGKMWSWPPLLRMSIMGDLPHALASVLGE